MDFRRLRHILNRRNPQECAAAIEELLLEADYQAMNGNEKEAKRMLLQVEGVRRELWFSLRDQLNRIEELIFEGCQWMVREERLAKLKVNSHEKLVAAALEQAGYTVYRNGWPDFLVVGQQQIFGVEVKRPGQKLRASQVRVRTYLKKAGIAVHVVTDPDNVRTITSSLT